MTPPQTRNELQNLIALLTGTGIVLRSNPIILRSDGTSRSVSWESPAGRAPLWIQDTASIAEYRRVIRLADYLCLLSDAAIIQAAFEFNGNDLVSHRLLWLPSPVRLPPVEPDDPIEEIIDILLDDGGKQILDEEPERADAVPLLLVAPLRFDYDPQRQAPGHPSSHLHICRSHCRIPVFSSLSLGHFIRTVFRHFYPDVWSTSDELREWALHSANRSVTREEEQEMFIDWRHPV